MEVIKKGKSVEPEFFCRRANVSAFSMQIETVLKSDIDKKGVLLQVMKIRWLDEEKGCKSVLWDTACSGMFVRMEHAERMNFPFQERKLRVRTLGDEEKDIEGQIYDCQIRDLEGKVYQFKAHSLESVTSSLGCAPDKGVLQTLFP